jgi:D-hydroxyproline dehydrogenase subunit beta
VKKVADVSVVGAGILGLAHAYAAARRGKSVTVFERDVAARGASVRNFGMIWPIGLPAGDLHARGMRSRELWLEVIEAAKLHHRPTGSLHLAYREDERSVAAEFAEIAPAHGYQCQWLNRKQVLERSAAVCPNGLAGGLWSAAELTVDPREVLTRLPAFLRERYGVQFVFDATVRDIEAPLLEVNGEEWEAENVIICNGDDFRTLYPELFSKSDITRCKLQMMRSVAQPNGWTLGPSLAAGLTFRFYPAFELCKSLPALRTRIANEMPEYDRWGIHVLVSQTSGGELTIGDSHQYGRVVEVFDKVDIDRLILDYLGKFLVAPDLRIMERWHGVYSKLPGQPYLSLSPEENVWIVTGVGGFGMTLSFGVAEQTIEKMGL